ncbi:hypothetical protein FYJ38_24510 [Clostridium sp. WB02_MRS01]|uniref:ribonuclease H1 domain-containing protein n=1 Tax=Clostridium sp. WB02_MRS01 TaxID=2605777 RepID=UPI0012B2A98C|nr:viroplasmin family protein [Clostridium sp. WB02_MRS01]MSS11773.1 hypothetical protein [Clostridium sp. WB02_MRS01]
MAKKNFYSVVRGVVPGIYKTWAECEANIKGYSGALYQGFVTEQEAQHFFDVNSSQDSNIGVTQDNAEKTTDYDKIIVEVLKNNGVVAFTDGGYDKKTDTAGYGVYILEPEGSKPIEISDIVHTDRFKDSNNIAPEIMGVTTALDWVLSNEYDTVTIFHDYEGIGKWANGNWTAKSEIAKWYIKQLNETYKEFLNISYIWVPGHKGIQYNEEADRLATEAIQRNTKPQFKMNETYFSCRSVVEKDLKDIMEQISKDSKITISEVENKQLGKMVYKLKYNNEKITISYYRKTVQTLVQGKANSLFALFLSFYTEKIPDFDLIQAYGKMHRSRIQLSEVDKYVESMNLPKDFPDDAIKLIKQAISEKIVLASGRKKDAFDYSHYIFPAFRALESSIKYYFELCGTHISETANIGGFFGKNDIGWYVTERRAKTSIYKDKLASIYAVYNRNRNSLGHFGELLDTEDGGSTTAMIETPEEALDIIDEILEEIKFDL